MICWVGLHIMAQPYAQYGQRPQECGLSPCKYYGSVKENDPTALN